MSTKTILVIGAGASGLASIKECKDGNLNVVCYEKTESFGGLWNYCEDERICVMKSTVSNTSKEMTAFSDFPPPEEYPMYLPHEYVFKYLTLYAEKFDLLSAIKYNKEVKEIIPANDCDETGKWTVKTCDCLQNEIIEEVFDGVMICTGHHAYPLLPSYEGMDKFKGKIIHSQDYKTFQGYHNKSVLVVGAGNSGGDIAVELSLVAKKVYLSTRRGVWIHPRFSTKGKPFDALCDRRYHSLKPASFNEKRMRKLLNNTMDHKKFGIEPCHNVLSQHPTVNDDIKCKLGCGKIILKKDIQEFHEHGVKFNEDDDIASVDEVIFATGYQIKIPFINEEVLKVEDNNKVHLYKFMFPCHLKHPSLAVIGLIQPSGGLFPVFEIQARWFVALMCRLCAFPTQQKMLEDVKKTEAFRAKSVVPSARHTIESNRTMYMDDLAEELKVKPNLGSLMFKDPKLFKALFFGTSLPYQYRLLGPHKWSDARKTILSFNERLYGSMYSQRHK